MGGVTVGYATGVTVGIKADLIKEFALNSNKAAILAQGNQSFPLTIQKMYVSTSYASQVYGGTPVNFVFGPQGSTTGNIKITLPNVVLTVHETKVDQKGIVSENVQGEASDYQIGSF
jgi:hypothetical protein